MNEAAKIHTGRDESARHPIETWRTGTGLTVMPGTGRYEAKRGTASFPGGCCQLFWLLLPAFLAVAASDITFMRAYLQATSSSTRRWAQNPISSCAQI